MSKVDHWGNYQAVLRAALAAVVANNSVMGAMVEAERKIGNCGIWAKRFLQSAKTNILICNCCGKTADYGIETLVQTGHQKQALELVRERLVGPVIRTKFTELTVAYLGPNRSFAGGWHWVSDGSSIFTVASVSIKGEA